MLYINTVHSIGCERGLTVTYKRKAKFFTIFVLIMAFVMNKKLAFVILVVIPFLTLAIFLILKTAFPRFTVMQKKLDRLIEQKEEE